MSLRLAAGDKHGCDTLRLRVTNRRPGAWKARGPDRRRSGGFGLSAKSDTKRIVSPHRGGQRAGCLVSSRPAPLLAGELKVPGLKRVNVGNSSLVSAFGKKRVIAKLISSASRPSGVVARYDNDPSVSVVMTISPVHHQK